MRTNTLFLVATAGAGVLLGASLPAASAATQYGTGDRPLEGQRYETLRALAHDLDVSAAQAHEQAKRDVSEYPARSRSARSSTACWRRPVRRIAGCGTLACSRPSGTTRVGPSPS